LGNSKGLVCKGDCIFSSHNIIPVFQLPSAADDCLGIDVCQEMEYMVFEKEDMCISQWLSDAYTQACNVWHYKRWVRFVVLEDKVESGEDDMKAASIGTKRNRTHQYASKRQRQNWVCIELAEPDSPFYK
jgi:hypothetical protein